MSYPSGQRLALQKASRAGGQIRRSASVRADLPLQLCWLATAGTQESDRCEYKHL